MSTIDVAGSIARIAQEIAEVGNSGGADESHCTFMRSAPAPRRRARADVWQSADPNNRMPLPLIQSLEQSLPKYRTMNARTSYRRKRYSRFVHCAFPFNNERGPIFRTGKLMFSSVDIQDLYAVMLACCDTEVLSNLESALAKCRMDVALWPMHG